MECNIYLAMFIVVYNLPPVVKLWFCFFVFQCLPILQGHHVSTEAQTDRTSGIRLCFCKLNNHLFAEDKAGEKVCWSLSFVHLSKCKLCEMMDRVCSSAQEEDVTVSPDVKETKTQGG